MATTRNAADDPVAALCEQLGVEVYRGDEHDVLGRFAAAAAAANAEALVRLTGDCPMIDPALIDDVVAVFERGAHDYISNCYIRTFPDGLDCEVFTRAALHEAEAAAKHPFLREHVTPYIRGSHRHFGPGDFRCGNVAAPADFSHVRWTLDTADDLARIRGLIALLPTDYSWMDALSVATRHPTLLGVHLRGSNGARR